MPPSVPEEPPPRRWRARLAGLALGIVSGFGGLLLFVELAGPLIGGSMLRHEALTTAVGGALGAALGILCARFVMRRQSVGSKLVLVACAALFGLMTANSICTIAKARERDDLIATRQIRIAPDGTPRLPSGIEGGRVARETLGFLRHLVGKNLARRAVDQRLNSVRLDPVHERSDRTLFTDCGRFARAKPEVDAIDNDVFDTIVAFRTRLGEIIDDPGYRATAIAEFDASYRAALAHRSRRRQLDHDALDHAGAICTLLSRRRWRISAKGWSFTDPDDHAAYNRLRAAIDRDRNETMSFTPAAGSTFRSTAGRPPPTAVFGL